MPEQGKKSIYLAAPLFSQAERLWNRSFSLAVEAAAPEFSIILPQDFRAGESFNDPHHFGEIFRSCISAIRSSAAVIAVLDGADADSGVAFEAGYAHALDIPLLALRSDYRAGQEKGVNLMLARSCRMFAREYSFREEIKPIGEAVARRLRRLLSRREPAAQPKPTVKPA